MNREQSTEYLNIYKNLPKSDFFSFKPINYPMFHVLESFTKGYRIDVFHGNGYLLTIDNIDFEMLAKDCKLGVNQCWKLVARNPNVTNSKIGFVQADLYSRYVGKCSPLKTPNTSWTFIPLDGVRGAEYFNGKIGTNTNLYMIEIDLDTTDIIGKWNDDVPWHYLQQTINWKPWQGRIDWQQEGGQL